MSSPICDPAEFPLGIIVPDSERDEKQISAGPSEKSARFAKNGLGR